MRTFNVGAYMRGENRNADTVVVPRFMSMIIMIISGYDVLDGEFRKDGAKFETFRNHYRGKSLQ